MNTPLGHLHPVTLLISQINQIFTDIGFDVEGGPELVTEEENFDTLNFPKDHPAREMQDTFYIDQNEGVCG
jgi:phenylalanyl-tRNA synthetase alpha chain